MSTLNDTPIKTIVEYHQRYSKGKIIHRGLKAYCRHCTRNINLGAVGYARARQLLLDQGWTLEDDEGNDLRWWHCPSCRSLFPEEVIVA